MRRVFTLIFLIGVSIILIAVFSASGGDTSDPGIQKRIEEQQKRIDEGISSGQLTRHEADILQDNLNWIKDKEARLKADGKLTPKERVRLHKALDHNSAMIFKKKHNPIKRLER